jgi:3-isopropylmalate dehydrogenase
MGKKGTHEMTDKKIAILEGDGIGPEVVAETVKVMEATVRRHGLSFTYSNGLAGGAALDAAGIPLPDETLTMCLESDAVLLGAVGGPKWEANPHHLKPEQALLKLRKELGLFANVRPAKIYPALRQASTLREEIVDGIDLIVMRELTGGIYFGEPKAVEVRDGMRVGYNTLIYSEQEIERIARAAFDMALKRQKRVTSVDKANVLDCMQLWRDVVIEVSADYPQVELNHLYVDNCAMQLVRDPRQFDVILTGNMFGDILSDEAAMLTGSIGMLPSASLGERTSMYEPVHGSAPDIAGEGVANPLATIASAAMMFRYSFDMPAAADAIETAIEEVLNQGYRTADLHGDSGKIVSTSDMGDLVVEHLGY